jgi:hypothetical protein
VFIVFIYFVSISLLLAGQQSLTHIYLFSIPCILIGYHLLGGSFLSRCTVFQHSLSLIALLHHYLYHFYLLRRIFVGLILLPQEITTTSLLDPLTFALSPESNLREQSSLRLATLFLPYPIAGFVEKRISSRFTTQGTWGVCTDNSRRSRCGFTMYARCKRKGGRQQEWCVEKPGARVQEMSGIGVGRVWANARGWPRVKYKYFIIKK